MRMGHRECSYSFPNPVVHELLLHVLGVAAKVVSLVEQRNFQTAVRSPKSTVFSVSHLPHRPQFLTCRQKGLKLPPLALTIPPFHTASLGFL